MQRGANARFAIKHWDEKPYSEGKDLPKLTRGSVTKTFTGDIEGEGQVEYLMMYRSDGSATFVGGATARRRSSGSSVWSAGWPVRPARSCCNAPGYSRAAWRRSPIPWCTAPERESFAACAARAPPRWGTASSIR